MQTRWLIHARIILKKIQFHPYSRDMQVCPSRYFSAKTWLLTKMWVVLLLQWLRVKGCVDQQQVHSFLSQRQQVVVVPIVYKCCWLPVLAIGAVELFRAPERKENCHSRTRLGTSVVYKILIRNSSTRLRFCVWEWPPLDLPSVYNSYG